MTNASILSRKQKIWLRRFARVKGIRLDIRALSGILYLLRTDCQWRMIPTYYGKWKTLYQKFRAWTASDWFNSLHYKLISRIRQKSGRGKSPRTVVIDSQSVRSGLPRSCKGIDGGKRIKGIKRHIAVDAIGLPLQVVVTKANIHDAKAAYSLLPKTIASHPSVALIKADNGYRGRLAADVNGLFGKTVDCVKSNHGTSDFIPYNGRWVVERTIAWMDNFRRLSRNYEQHLHTAESMARLAMIAILLNKL